MSEELARTNIDRAQAEIERSSGRVRQGKQRQHYHFMAQTGWINDPNGLIWFRGKYHYFYQFNPYSGFWSRMHWGHAVSEDLIHWEYLPVALAPSEWYDDHPEGGCFSGSAMEHDGKLFLMYTGVTNRGRGFEQSQCIAYSEDGIHFEKYEGNPVIPAPEGVPTHMFRDPKVWKHENMYYMICGASRENRAQALLYRSEDMLHWTFVNILAESRGEWGYMWECPDFYPVGDKYVLMFSPMGGGERTSVYLVGDFDYKTGKFHSTVSGEIDWGHDFYAPQSFQAPDGRRLLVGWANAWDWMPFWKDWGPTYREGWCGFFNVPREVKLMPDQSLQFVPVRELSVLREDGHREESLEIDDREAELSPGDGISFEMKMEVDLEKSDADRLELYLRSDGEKRTVCTFDFAKGEMTVDRNNSDGWSCGRSRSTLFLKNKKKLDIHVFSDQSSIEIFADKYQNNHSNNIFAGELQNKASIRAYGGKVLLNHYESYKLKGCFS